MSKKLKDMDTDQMETETLRLVKDLLDGMGKDSYGGGDPEAIKKLEEQHDKETATSVKEIKKQKDFVTALDKTLKSSIKSEKSMRKKLEEVLLKPIVSLAPVVGDGTIPDGHIEMKKVSEIFSSVKWSKDFEVPVWQWDGVHPHVPAVDTKYIFRAEELTKVLYSIITNQRCYLQGHTGSGKTTLIEQAAAALNYPFKIVNLQSEITSMDLVGKTDLTTDKETGQTITNFSEGIIPKAMQGPYILCCDELDFIRPDVAYVMQRLFEGNDFTLLEDGGRVIQPDPNFRIFATANTVGQGDENGMYQGSRPQSLAMLDRFTVWIRVKYLDKAQRLQLITDSSPTLNLELADKLNQYVTEHLEAFTSASVLQPISPRGFLSIAEATVRLAKMNNNSDAENLKQALTMCVLDRASGTDRVVLEEFVQRVSKGTAPTSSYDEDEIEVPF
ncbi:MAG: AAA family ATPase [Oleispira sp.]|nr:AAA family ATPase [Oleispira sp.]